MNTNHMIGISNIVRRRPLALSVATQNITHRLTHLFTRQRSLGWSAPPEQITFVITDACNLRCKMCQYAYSASPGYQLNRNGTMPAQLFRKIVDEVPGHPIITITGGEPLLHPEIAELLAYARHKGHFCTLTTNGWLLEKHAAALCQSGLDLLVVSVDGPQEVHDAIRGKHAFMHLAAGLRAVMAQPHHPIIFVSTVISDLSQEHLIPMFEQAQAWGVDGINFSHLWMQTHEMVETQNSLFSIFAADEIAWEVQPEKIDPCRVADALQEIRRRTRFSSLTVTQTPDLSQEEIATWYRQPERFVKYASTRCAWTRMKVWPNGDLKPYREWVVGNVAQAPAMEVWNGEKFRSFRRLLAERGTLPICARCCYMAYR
jgi:Fe-coproporphyrin III synthase